MSTPIEPTICPKCNHLLDTSSDPLGDHSPNPGDVSVCAYCGHVGVYAIGPRGTTQLTIEEIPEGLLAELKRYSPELAAILAVREEIMGNPDD